MRFLLALTRHQQLFRPSGCSNNCDQKAALDSVQLEPKFVVLA